MRKAIRSGSSSPKCSRPTRCRTSSAKTRCCPSRTGGSPDRPSSRAPRAPGQTLHVDAIGILLHHGRSSGDGSGFSLWTAARRRRRGQGEGNPRGDFGNDEGDELFNMIIMDALDPEDFMDLVDVLYNDTDFI
mmetsp:Transcript_8696/g.18717  ORF Transcript_8696/g.18717 Transcript_8696/m.18717 type:complete len:133 (-) Transcript_8696:79-477(-)